VTIEGVFTLPKVLTDVIGVGDNLYWDSSAEKLTKTPDGREALGGLRHQGRRQRRGNGRLPRGSDADDGRRSMRTLATAIIPAEESLSGPVDLADAPVVGIYMPAEWDSASMTFQGFAQWDRVARRHKH